MIAKIGEPGAELSALEREVMKLGQERDRLLALRNPPKDKRAAVRRAINRSLCAERGFNERWPNKQLEALVTTANGDEIDYAPLLALRGWLLLEKGQLRKAIADAEAALKLQPGEPRAYLVRGRARLEQGNLKLALGDLRKATELTRSEDAVALHWFAAALLEAGQTKQAVETQRLAVLLRPNDAELQEQLRRMKRIESKDSDGPRQP
jgi:tetratricopeptide (TPR) repeat protein